MRLNVKCESHSVHNEIKYNSLDILVKKEQKLFRALVIRKQKLLIILTIFMLYIRPLFVKARQQLPFLNAQISNLENGIRPLIILTEMN